MVCHVQVKRATKFLNILFKHAPEPVVLVVTHSGFARSLLLAMQREPYRPQNAELIPAIVEQKSKKGSGDAADEAEEIDDSWIDDVLDRHADLLQDLGGKLQQQEQGRAGKSGKQQKQCIVRRFVAWAMQKLHSARQ